MPADSRSSLEPVRLSSRGVGALISPRIDPQPGRLQLGVLVERVQRLVAAVAALLEAAERHRDVVLVVLVHVHGAGAQRARDAVRAVDVVAPDAGLQAVGACRWPCAIASASS